MKSLTVQLTVCLGLLSLNGFYSCNNPGVKEIAVKDTLVFERMLGTWKNNRQQNFERWTKTSDSSYQSDVFSVTRNDTSFEERAAVFMENGKWVFQAIVNNQNEQQPIKFTADTVGKATITFSNSSHDFPTAIGYRLRNSDTLAAFISGPNKKGGLDTLKFLYVRRKS
ncbi:MAG: hypothetical protein H7Y31_09815 [Chitinophagaceae bacterium]|nr:hypothetical protein [Chitinophagaceae bacterium]